MSGRRGWSLPDNRPERGEAHGRWKGRQAMIEVDVSDAQDRPKEPLDLVAAGEEVVIARDGPPVARLTAIEPRKKSRTPGSAEGRIFISDDFDDPLPKEIQAAFEGRDERTRSWPDPFRAHLPGAARSVPEGLPGRIRVAYDPGLRGSLLRGIRESRNRRSGPGVGPRRSGPPANGGLRGDAHGFRGHLRHTVRGVSTDDPLGRCGGDLRRGVCPRRASFGRPQHRFQLGAGPQRPLDVPAGRIILPPVYRVRPVVLRSGGRTGLLAERHLDHPLA